MSLHERTAEELVQLYVDAAQRHAHLNTPRDVNSVNAAADQLAAIHREFRSRPNDDGVALLLPLLRHKTPNVRLWAAAHLLDSSPNEAVPMLEELATTRGVSLEASTTLAEWRAGRLRFS